ncbi:MAG: ATP-binding cassette domain-containing protein [Planctomycetales bacterium]|nr:ATP-binding cassette domain-containing protein [Planctomycetales bacterium]MBN8627030.1 ATP-binding cassette domain-containing protein [Planctomycetota bacterium]
MNRLTDSTSRRQRGQLATRESPSLRGDKFAENCAICISGLCHTFGEGELRKQVLFDNDLQLARGEIVIMTGPSGSGKTTLLTLIGALRTVQQGGIEVRGKQLWGLSSSQLVDVRRNIGFIFQAHNLFTSLTALQNVRMALELKENNRAEMDRRAEEMLKAVGLGHRIHYKPQQLSGGQRQRVAIARALVHNPQVILADEPTAALDKQSGRDVVNLLKRFAKEQGATILIVTHDNRILDVADRIVNMVDGRIISDVVVSESQAICDFLRRVPLFNGLLPDTLTKVADQMELRECKPGETVFRQGDPGDNFYLIRSGEAEVVFEDGGTGKVVATLDEGKFFGEMALETGEPRKATVRAKTDLTLCALDKEEYLAVKQSSATFHEEISKVLFERQR